MTRSGTENGAVVAALTPPEYEHIMCMVRLDLEDEIPQAAERWKSYARARADMDRQWERLRTDTPADLFPTRVLGVLDAHRRACDAAREWDWIARRLDRAQSRGQLATIQAWEWDVSLKCPTVQSVAAELGVDTQAWEIDTGHHDFKVTGPHREEGPTTRDLMKQIHGQRSMVRDLGHLLGLEYLRPTGEGKSR